MEMIYKKSDLIPYLYVKNAKLNITIDSTLGRERTQLEKRFCLQISQDIKCTIHQQIIIHLLIKKNMIYLKRKSKIY